MEQVKIKRIKRDKKPITAQGKILAGLGVAGTIMGGAGAAAQTAPAQTIVSGQTSEQSTATSKVKAILNKVFGSVVSATVGVPQARADAGAGAPTSGDPGENVMAGMIGEFNSMAAASNESNNIPGSNPGLSQDATLMPTGAPVVGSADATQSDAPASAAPATASNLYNYGNTQQGEQQYQNSVSSATSAASQPSTTLNYGPSAATPAATTETDDSGNVTAVNLNYPAASGDNAASTGTDNTDAAAPVTEVAVPDGGDQNQSAPSNGAVDNVSAAVGTAENSSARDTSDDPNGVPFSADTPNPNGQTTGFGANSTWSAVVEAMTAPGVDVSSDGQTVTLANGRTYSYNQFMAGQPPPAGSGAAEVNPANITPSTLMGFMGPLAPIEPTVTVTAQADPVDTVMAPGPTVLNSTDQTPAPAPAVSLASPDASVTPSQSGQTDATNALQAWALQQEAASAAAQPALAQSSAVLNPVTADVSEQPQTTQPDSGGFVNFGPAAPTAQQQEINSIINATAASAPAPDQSSANLTAQPNSGEVTYTQVEGTNQFLGSDGNFYTQNAGGGYISETDNSTQTQSSQPGRSIFSAIGSTLSGAASGVKSGVSSVVGGNSGSLQVFQPFTMNMNNDDGTTDTYTVTGQINKNVFVDSTGEIWIQSGTDKSSGQPTFVDTNITQGMLNPATAAENPGAPSVPGLILLGSAVDPDGNVYYSYYDSGGQVYTLQQGDSSAAPTGLSVNPSNLNSPVSQTPATGTRVLNTAFSLLGIGKKK